MILETVTGQVVDSKDLNGSRVLGMEKRLKFNGWLIFFIGLFFIPIWLLFCWKQKIYQVQLRFTDNKNTPIVMLDSDEYKMLSSILASGDAWSNTNRVL